MIITWHIVCRIGLTYYHNYINQERRTQKIITCSRYANLYSPKTKVNNVVFVLCVYQTSRTTTSKPTTASCVMVHYQPLFHSTLISCCPIAVLFIFEDIFVKNLLKMHPSMWQALLLRLIHHVYALPSSERLGLMACMTWDI